MNMPYIGMFSEESIQKNISHVYDKMGDSTNGLVAHLDSDGNMSVSYVKKIDNVWSIEATGVMDISQGFKFDKEHLKAQAELIGKW
jgi:hypothetical protein